MTTTFYGFNSVGRYSSETALPKAFLTGKCPKTILSSHDSLQRFARSLRKQGVLEFWVYQSGEYVACFTTEEALV